MQQTLEMVQLLAKLTIEYIEVISIKFKQLCNACKPNTLESLHPSIVHGSLHSKVGNTLEIPLNPTTTLILAQSPIL